MTVPKVCGPPNARNDGSNEDKVTCPRLYRVVSGDLLFIYRYGNLDSGAIMFNRFDTKKQDWTAVNHPETG